jgi:anti-sigma-K factor RskA
VAADTDDIDALAGEYVLGTLDTAERSAAEARLLTDAAFRVAVAAWELRLQPLSDTARPVDPSRDLFAEIMARIAIDAGRTQSPEVEMLRRDVSRWRVATAFTSLAAVACLAVALTARPSTPEKYVATLTPQGGAPGFVLTVDTVKHTMTVSRVADAAPPGKSYQLWAIEPGEQPKSLGVVEQARYEQHLDVPADNLTLAISLEPPGGSPTSAPTGPVVFSGALIKP